MDINRERVIWAYACKSCMNRMDDNMILQICNTNRDIFSVENDTVTFTKEFLDETTAEKLADMS